MTETRMDPRDALLDMPPGFGLFVRQRDRDGNHSLAWIAREETETVARLPLQLRPELRVGAFGEEVSGKTVVLLAITTCFRGPEIDLVFESWLNPWTSPIVGDLIKAAAISFYLYDFELRIARRGAFVNDIADFVEAFESERRQLRPPDQREMVIAREKAFNRVASRCGLWKLLGGELDDFPFPL